MITNPAMVAAFEAEQASRAAADLLRNLRLLDALYHEARTLGVFPLTDPLDDIETDICLARALNILNG